MRKLVAHLFYSLDGVVEAPDQWTQQHFDESMGAEMFRQISQIDTALLGRKTYQEWEHYWPNSGAEPFASFINQTPKFVVSKTLDHVGWAGSTLIRGDLAQAIAALKQQPGKNIGVQGSPTLVAGLLDLGLLDELILSLFPLVVGKGRRLFQDAHALRGFQLAESKISGTGVAMLTYRPAA